jgi:hypothetical protein
MISTYVRGRQGNFVASRLPAQVAQAAGGRESGLTASSHRAASLGTQATAASSLGPVSAHVAVPGIAPRPGHDCHRQA